MEYLFWGMFAGVVTIAAVDFIFAQEKRMERSYYKMTGAMLFLLGFSAVTAVYEVAKTGRTTKSDKISRTTERIGKKNKWL